MTAVDTDTRSRIIASARTCFARRGYDGTTNKDVAADAGITSAAIYHWFESKDALYRAAIESVYEEVFGRYEEATRSADGFVDRVLAMLECSLRLHQEDPALAAFAAAVPFELQRRPSLATPGSPALRAATTFYGVLVDHGIATGELDRSVDRRAVIDLLVVTNAGLATLASVTGDGARHRAVSDMVGALFAGTLLRQHQTSETPIVDTAPTLPQIDRLLGLEAEALACPHAAFAELRADQPVAWSDELDCFIVTRYDDVLHVLHDAALFSNQMPTGSKASRQMMETMMQLLADSEEMQALMADGGADIVGSKVLLMADPPEHSRQRGLVNRAFTPRRVRLLHDEIADITDRLIDGFIERGTAEFVGEFAVALPMTVIARALGVPESDMADFRRWSDGISSAIGNHHLGPDELLSLVQNQVGFGKYFTDVIEARRAAPHDDLISDLVGARIDGEELTLKETLGMLSQFLVAGNETTAKLLSGSMCRLAHDHELRARLVAEPGLLPAFIEEMLRLESPVQGLFRVATADTTIGDVAIPAGSSIWAVYAAANRDPEVFDQPDSVRLDRPTNPHHIAFGHGAHYCLGAALARAEAEIGLERLLERLGDFSLDTDDLAYDQSYVLHGLSALPLRFTPGARRA